MTAVQDPATGLPVGTPNASIIHDALEASGSVFQSIENAIERFILSASGFRAVFAEDGNEEADTSDIRQPDAVIVAVMVARFVKLLKERAGAEDDADVPLRIAVGIDSRPTGPAIADVCIRTLAGLGVDVRYLFIVPAPEIMAYTRIAADLSGFVFVSASHNPIGHNGLKFGRDSGGVLDPEEASVLIRELREIFSSPGAPDHERTIRGTVAAAAGVSAETMERIFRDAARWKSESLRVYREFAGTVVTGAEDPEKRDGLLSDLRTATAAAPVGVIAELNGSARTVSIDREFLQSIGVEVEVQNGTPRQIVHRIVPEGVSLDPARIALEARHRADPRYVLAYVPDNDGDRGNLVFIDGDEARAIEAQEVFALCCVAELSWLVYSGELTYDARGRARQKVAVAVNGPTSLRIDRIAEAFDADVFRSEVGEANVVNLARALRRKGYIVRILGEGSNGGNITHPSSVRDPINTVTAMVKLLTLCSVPERPGLFEIWCRRSGHPERFNNGATLGEIISTLPRFMTTSAYEPRAVMHIRTRDHGELKARYERIFAEQWELRKPELEKRLGIRSWKEFNYEGLDEKQGVGRAFRTPPESGGLKIVFKDETGKIKAYIWMRGSGTEPVFRVLADVESVDPADEGYLLDWHVSMVTAADDGADGSDGSR